MISADRMNAIREVVATLRQAKGKLGEIWEAIDEDKDLLPERQWRSAVDDDMSEVCVSIETAGNTIDDVLGHLAEVTGEDISEDSGASEEAQFRAPLPATRPSYEEVDRARGQRADAIRAKRRGEG
jgi:hypothetical protein